MVSCTACGYSRSPNLGITFHSGVKSMKKIPTEFSENEKVNKTESQENYFPSSTGYTPSGAYGTNVVLVGVMLSGIILFAFIYCFWCHKSDKKTDPHLSNYGEYPDLPPEIYTVESADHSLDVDALTSPNDGLERISPPPAYEVAVSTQKENEMKKEVGLPSYEYAIQHLSSAWH